MAHDRVAHSFTLFAYVYKFYFIYFFYLVQSKTFRTGPVLPRMPIKARHSYIEISDIIIIVINYMHMEKIGR